MSTERKYYKAGVVYKIIRKVSTRRKFVAMRFKPPLRSIMSEWDNATVTLEQNVMKTGPKGMEKLITNKPLKMTTDGRQFEGTTLDEFYGDYYALLPGGDNLLIALPLPTWYDFQRINNFWTMTPEQAEEQYKNHKALFRFSNAIIRKRIERKAAEEAEENQSPGGRTIPKEVMRKPIKRSKRDIFKYLEEAAAKEKASKPPKPPKDIGPRSEITKLRDSVKDTVRELLIRKPMTQEQLIEEIKTRDFPIHEKKIGKLIKVLLSEIKAEEKVINGKTHFSLTVTY